MLLTHLIRLALFFARARAGKIREASIPIIAITTNNSIKVNAEISLQHFLFPFLIKFFIVYPIGPVKRRIATTGRGKRWGDAQAIR